VAIGKWLESGCKLIVFDEPKRGIDIGTKAEIYQLMDRLAAEGTAILMISSELNETGGMSDRVYVMREGKIVMEFGHEELPREAMISYAVVGENNQMLKIHLTRPNPLKISYNVQFILDMFKIKWYY
jgi:ABC-type sugar transport system ATPase subunit